MKHTSRRDSCEYLLHFLGTFLSYYWFQKSIEVFVRDSRRKETPIFYYFASSVRDWNIEINILLSSVPARTFLLPHKTIQFPDTLFYFHSYNMTATPWSITHRLWGREAFALRTTNANGLRYYPTFSQQRPKQSRAHETIYNIFSNASGNSGAIENLFDIRVRLPATGYEYTAPLFQLISSFVHRRLDFYSQDWTVGNGSGGGGKDDEIHFTKLAFFVVNK